MNTRTRATITHIADLVLIVCMSILFTAALTFTGEQHHYETEVRHYHEQTQAIGVCHQFATQHLNFDLAESTCQSTARIAIELGDYNNADAKFMQSVVSKYKYYSGE